jgi:hypothetical protein
MNKEKLEIQIEAIQEIFSNADKVKGEAFTDMVRFVGTIQSFGTMMLSECYDLGASKERMETMSERCALFSSALCGAHARALDLSTEQFDEVFKMANQVDARIQDAVKD